MTNTRKDLDRYVAACDYPGELNEVAVTKHLRAYLTALGVKRRVVRLESGWRLVDHPSIRRNVDWGLDYMKEHNPNFARVARVARVASVARDARVARDASVARDARDAAIQRFAAWLIQRGAYWWWDLPYVVPAYLGALQINKPEVVRWSRPLFEAFVSGAWLLYWTDDTLYWVAKPTIRKDDQKRIHCENGPALVSDVEPLYFWHGVYIPDEWITNKDKLTPQMALTWDNIEQRRAACEIVGWDKILRELHAKTIDKDGDPQIGELIEVKLPDGGPQRFLRVLCATGRRFAIPVPREMKTALAANAATYGLPATIFKPEVRT